MGLSQILRRFRKEPLRTIIISNLNEQPMGVVLEPWAMYGKVDPGKRAEVIFRDDPSYVIEFSITEAGEAFVAVDDLVRFTVNGRVVYEP